MIGIVETGAGNLTSVRAALDRLGRTHATLATPDTDGVDALVVPGQGHFGAVMDRLDQTGWRQALLGWIAEDRPLLGICVGQQILFEGSEEAPEAAGLGVLAGRVERLDFPKRPMVGWAPVEWAEGEDLAPGDAYFVNSFAVRDSDAAISRVTYGETFVAAVRRGRVLGVQFHPEKSGAWGQSLLGQLLATDSADLGASVGGLTEAGGVGRARSSDEAR